MTGSINDAREFLRVLEETLRKPSFKKFTHTSFGNVFQNIKKQMVASTSLVHGPDVEEEDDDKGEWLSVYKNYFISITLMENLYILRQ